MPTTDMSSTVTSPRQDGLPLLVWLRWLFEPHKSLTDDLARRRAQLLAGMISAALLVGTIAILWNVITYPSTRDDLDTWIVIAGLGILCYAMILNRTGRVTRAAQVFVGIMIPVFTIVPFLEGAQRQLSFFAVIPILASGIFFSVSTTAYIAVGITITVTALSLITTVNATSAWILPTFFLSLSSGLVYLFIKHLQFQEFVRTARLQEMNRLLHASEISLEQRVQDRTRDLQVAADISLQITTQLDSSQLLANVVEQTAKAFNLYHVSVFLYDETDELLRLKQGVGDVGNAMVADGGQFKLTDKGLVPGAAFTRQPKLSNNVAQDPLYISHPLLPETQSELAIPILYGGKLVGVLDLQSEQLARFGDEDTRIMRTLADQIAVAVQNSQLFALAKAAQEEAEKSDRVKSAFLASMSHELRTPLNAIINFSKFLRKGIPGPVNEEQEELIGSIADSGQHLLNLINDVLDMSKIESGSLKLYVESDIDMRPIVATAIQYTHPLIDDKPIELQVALPDELPLITGDRKRLLQIFLNILSNACKFTEKGFVKLQLQTQGEKLLVSVADTGSGIAPEDSVHVFTPFKQTESGLRQGGNGTGLGMPICRKLVEAHHGRIWFESQVNVGTTFYVELPLHANLISEKE